MTSSTERSETARSSATRKQTSAITSEASARGPSRGSPKRQHLSSHSSGSPAEISVQGTPVVSLNDLTLVCSSMPANSFGFFLVSQTQGFVANPGGSSGDLCIAGPSVGRYAGHVMQADVDGMAEMTVDLSAIPPPSGPVPALPGATWYFQYWHRDQAHLGGATSTFSDAVCVTFQ